MTLDQLRETLGSLETNINGIAEDVAALKQWKEDHPTDVPEDIAARIDSLVTRTSEIDAAFPGEVG